MEDTVVIVSRGRPKHFARLLERWCIWGFDVILVLDEDDKTEEQYLDAIPDGDDTVLVVENRYKGVGGAHQTGLEWAAEMGLRSIVFSNDDIWPVKDRNPAYLLRTADDKRALGVGAHVDYHDFALKPHLDRHELEPLRYWPRPFLCPTGIAFRLFALNVENACDIGGFDTEFTCQNEDGELMRQGIAHGFPWLIDPRVHATSLGGRYADGGVADYLGLKDAAAADIARHNEVRRIHALAYKRWPTAVSHPSTGSIRTRWSKLYDANIPNWRDRSELHGAQQDWKGDRIVEHVER